jgi:hypothetical protein
MLGSAKRGRAPARPVHWKGRAPARPVPPTKTCQMIDLPPDDDGLLQFQRTVLRTDPDGRARFHQELVPLAEGSPASRLSTLMPSTGYQLRCSPVGFRSAFHCTGSPQWVFILQGCMGIGLQDGSERLFGPGEHFYSADTLPEGAVFDPALHGHCSRQVGELPLVTLFLRG